MRNKILIIILLFVTNLGFGLLFSWPRYRSWTREQSSIDKLSSEIGDLKTKQEAISKIKADEATVTQKATAAQQLFPVTDERERFASELDDLAKANSLSLLTFTFDEGSVSSKKTSTTKAKGPVKKTAKEKAGVKSIGFTAQLTGDYNSLVNFLVKLGTFNRYTSVDSLQLSASNETLATTIKGQIYTKGEPAIPAKLSFDPASWSYLDAINTPAAPTTPAPVGGRPNPFAPF